MLMDAGIIAVAYIVAWMIRFIGPFSYSAVRVLTFQQYMFALIFIIPGYLLLYQAFTLYEPLSMQGRRLVLANIIKANVLGLLLVVFSLYMMGESDFSRLTVYIFCVINIFMEWSVRLLISYIGKDMRRRGRHQKQMILVAIFPFVIHFQKSFRRMLKIAVHHCYHISRCLCHARKNSRFLSEVAGKMYAQNMLILFSGSLDFFPGSVL